jgi:4a-hydroxytetrahydrobiopterin dehydratase
MAPTALSDEDIRTQLRSSPEWLHHADRISRSFVFSDFAEAFGFMSEIAIVAERLNHHPEWSNVWNRVDVELTTHDVAGLSELDFQLAQRMDAAAAKR